MTDFTFRNPLHAGLYLNTANILDIAIDREQMTATIKILDAIEDKKYIVTGSIVEEEATEEEQGE